MQTDGRFSRFFTISIDNAIKFSGNDSSITIEVTEKNEKVFVSVKDTGMGIPKKELNKNLGTLLQVRPVPRKG